MDVVLTLSDVHPRDRLAYWYDVACKVFVDHECRVTTPAQFDVTMQHMALSDLGVVNIESLGLGFAEVTARTIANGEDDVFFLCLQLEGGATLSQDGREAVIEPGDFVLLDAQRPYSCRYTTNWRQIIIKIPHRSLNARLAASSELTACPVRSSTAVGGLTSGFIRMIPERVEVLQPVAKTQIAEHVLDLAALALAAETAKDKPALSSGRAIALLQLRVAIENRLRRPNARSEQRRCCRRHQRALRKRASVRAGDLASAIHRVAPPRPLPPRAGGSHASAAHHHRHRFCLGLLGPVAFQSPLQSRVRLRAARLPPALPVLNLVAVGCRVITSQCRLVAGRY